MKHKGTVTIETESLILRRYQSEDAASAFKNWMSSEEVTRYLTWYPHKSVEEAKAYIDECCIKNYDDPAFYNWVITDKETGEAIGSISVVDLKEDVDCVEVGYCLSERYWGRGLMTQALFSVIRFFFEEVEARRIQATHDSRNPASGKVMEKCGMLYEGTLRQYNKNISGICDSVMRAILREDYLKQTEKER